MRTSPKTPTATATRTTPATTRTARTARTTGSAGAGAVAAEAAGADVPEAAAEAGRKALEGTFDHGEEGYGLWLDPAVQDNPLYAEHWRGHRPVKVTVEADRIVIERSGSADD